MKNKINLILHPVRMRIITTVTGRAMTSQELGAALIDVPQATLYRHINILLKGGILTVVDTKQIRGTVEKTYTLNPQANLDLSDDLENATAEDHIQYFTTFLATLMADFTRYTQRSSDIAPERDGVGYHSVPLYMSDEDVQNFGSELQKLIQPYLKTADDSQRRMFSFVIMPSDDVLGDEK